MTVLRAHGRRTWATAPAASLLVVACGAAVPEPASAPGPAPASNAASTASHASRTAPHPTARSATASSTPASFASGAMLGASDQRAPTAGVTPAPSATPSELVSGATCSEGMSLVWRFSGPYCIDRFEGSIVRVGGGSKEAAWPHNHAIDGHEREVRAVSVKGVRPQGYISGLQAAQACRRSGKRLCEVDEWVRACRGPELTTYPYGNERRAGACNDRFRVLDHHPVPMLWKKDGHAPGDVLMWHPEFMNDSRLLELAHTTERTGAHPDCTNAYGVYDMVGNLHEWVNDSEGTFFGGFFMDTFQNGEGCEYRTLGHGAEYHDYSTGFRCCAEVTWQ